MHIAPFIDYVRINLNTMRL